MASTKITPLEFFALCKQYGVPLNVSVNLLHDLFEWKVIAEQTVCIPKYEQSETQTDLRSGKETQE